MDEREIAKLKSAFGAASARLLLFDYDGTLVNYTPVPSTATLPEDVSVLLRRLSSFPFTEIFIISGRSYRDIESLVGHLPVKIIAEHGAMIREKGIWKREVEDDGLWKKSVLPVFNQVTQSCQHSYIEEKIYSLTWHYRAAAPESGYENSRRLIGLLNNILPSLGLKLLDGNKVVEVMKSVVGKGRAVKELVGNEDHDFILAIGDEPTVENKPFTEASFNDAWNQYISVLENSGKSRISVFLKESPIKFLSEVKVEIELKSQLEKDTIEEERMEMIPMLRKQLQNFELDIVFTINKDRIVHLGKVSKSDQLKRMVEKNPNLGDFVQGLGLEIDY